MAWIVAGLEGAIVGGGISAIGAALYGVGIPRNSPGGYYLTNVLFTQYFLPTGQSIHYNWWSSSWGYPGSHGCLGLPYADAAFMWSFATIGTPVSIHY